MSRIHSLFPLALAALLSACGGSQPANSGAVAGEDSLPKPAPAGGSVTGMPDPGTATPDPGRVATPAEAAATEASAPGADTSPAAADPAAAVALLRDYYAALNARDFTRAHALWQQNPQTPAQLEASLAGATGVSVDIGAPGPVDAGQASIEIPVRVDITFADGHVDHYSGRHVLTLGTPAGGVAGWRITSATLGKQ